MLYLRILLPTMPPLSLVEALSIIVVYVKLIPVKKEKHADKHIDIHIDKHIDTHTDTHIDKYIDKHTYIHIDKHIDKHMIKI